MKYLIVYAYSVNNGPQEILNMLATDEKTPIKWIAYLNSLEDENKDSPVARKYVLINWWVLSDADAEKLDEYGLGLITLKGGTKEGRKKSA